MLLSICCQLANIAVLLLLLAFKPVLGRNISEVPLTDTNVSIHSGSYFIAAEAEKAKER